MSLSGKVGLGLGLSNQGSVVVGLGFVVQRKIKASDRSLPRESANQRFDLHLSLSRARKGRYSRDVVVVGLELVVQIKVRAFKRSGLGLSLWPRCEDLCPLFICKALLG